MTKAEMRCLLSMMLKLHQTGPVDDQFTREEVDLHIEKWGRTRAFVLYDPTTAMSEVWTEEHTLISRLHQTPEEAKEDLVRLGYELMEVLKPCP